MTAAPSFFVILNAVKNPFPLLESPERPNGCFAPLNMTAARLGVRLRSVGQGRGRFLACALKMTGGEGGCRSERLAMLMLISRSE